MMEMVNTDMVIADTMGSLVGIIDDDSLLGRVKTVLELHLCRLRLYTEETALSTSLDCAMDCLKQFLLNMKLNGCTDNSIKAYACDLRNMLAFVDKPIRDIRINDLRSYLANGKINRKWGDRTYNTKLIMTRSFFGWLYEEDLIEQNPAKKLKETKVERRMGTVLTPEQRELVRCSCADERELAICDMLYTSGIRVSELCGLDRKDVDFANLKAVVYGKGRKEREVYFNGQTKVHLQKYLESRTDSNEALFVSAVKPHGRLTPGAVRCILKNVKNRDGDMADVRVTPHTYRRSMATDMINRGAPLEIVGEVLGHVNIDTTKQCYAALSRETVQRGHGKYAS